MVINNPEQIDVARERRSMLGWGLATIVTGGLAIADTAFEVEIASIPVLGWLADILNAVPDLGLIGAAVISANRTIHHWHRMQVGLGKRQPENLPPQIPRRSGRR